jgi:hypothetical protein
VDLIVGHDGKIMDEGGSGNEDVRFTDQLSAASQLRAGAREEVFAIESDSLDLVDLLRSKALVHAECKLERILTSVLDRLHGYLVSGRVHPPGFPGVASA